MDLSNFYIVGLIGLVAVVAYVLLHKRKVNSVMEANTDVVPLMMQRATQNKVSRLQQATLSNPEAANELQMLVAGYKANEIGIKEYNDRLDRMISTFNVD